MTTKELLALVGKATPGPWVAENGSIVNRECDLDADSNRMHLDLSWDIGEAYHPDNLALIVAAVNALPALCAEVEALRKDAERYRWLRSGPDRPCAQPCAYAFRPTDKEYPTPIGGDALDAAIDAARSRNEHEG